MRDLNYSFVAMGIAILVALTSPAAAQSAVRDGFDSNTLDRNDDGSTGEVDIGFEVNFFGVNATQLYVNNNGNVTFEEALSSYTPFDLTSTERLIIAPFFADVDTRNAGDPVTYGQGMVEGRAAFGVNWVNVDYYSSSESHTNRNSFQLVLIERYDTGPGNFDIEFNYDQIEWETGTASDGDSDGLGGDSARVGFSNGTGDEGTFFELEGSAINGAFLDGGPSETSLVQNSLNSMVPGRYIFFAREGGVTTVGLAPEYDALTAKADLAYLVTRHQLQALRDQAVTMATPPHAGGKALISAAVMDENVTRNVDSLAPRHTTDMADTQSMILALAPQATWQVGQQASVFLTGHISDGDMDADAGAPAHDFETKSVTGGVRFVVDENILAGIAIGWSEGDADTKGTATPTNLDVEGRVVSAFATMQLEQGRYISGAVGHQELDYKSRRFIGPNTYANASTGGSVVFAGLEGGWTEDHDGISFGPIATVDYYRVDLDGFTETGAGSANLTVAGSEDDVFAASLGVQAMTTWTDNQMTVQPFGRAAVAGRWGDSDRVASGYAGAGFSATSLQAGRDDIWLDVGAGITALLENADGVKLNAAIEYDGVLLNDNFEEHGGRVTFSLYF